jgi:iron complex transport system substrate-binding protein
MKKLITVLAATVAVIMLAGCSGTNQNSLPETQTEDSIKISHSLGTTEVPANPQKLVVLDYAALDIIDALGLGDQVVAIPKSGGYAKYLKADYIDNSGIEDVGTVKEVNLEAINALEPDLILIGGRLAGSYDQLSAIAPTVNVSIAEDQPYLDAVQDNATTLAQLWGAEDKVTDIFEDLNQQAYRISKKAHGQNALITMVSSGNISALGIGGRGKLIEDLGFTNLTTTSSTHGDTVSFEYIHEQNPDHLFVIDRDSAINTQGSKSAQDILNNDLVRQDNIIYLTPDAWYLASGGIQATRIMLDDIENGLGA